MTPGSFGKHVTPVPQAKTQPVRAPSIFGGAQQPESNIIQPNFEEVASMLNETSPSTSHTTPLSINPQTMAAPGTPIGVTPTTSVPTTASVVPTTSVPTTASVTPANVTPATTPSSASGTSPGSVGSGRGRGHARRGAGSPAGKVGRGNHRASSPQRQTLEEQQRKALEEQQRQAAADAARLAAEEQQRQVTEEQQRQAAAAEAARLAAEEQQRQAALKQERLAHEEQQRQERLNAYEEQQRQQAAKEQQRQAAVNQPQRQPSAAELERELQSIDEQQRRLAAEQEEQKRHMEQLQILQARQQALENRANSFPGSPNCASSPAQYPAHGTPPTGTPGQHPAPGIPPPVTIPGSPGQYPQELMAPAAFTASGFQQQPNMQPLVHPPSASGHLSPIRPGTPDREPSASWSSASEGGKELPQFTPAENMNVPNTPPGV